MLIERVRAGGELDGQRHGVEPVTHVRHEGFITGFEREVVARRDGAFDE